MTKESTDNLKEKIINISLVSKENAAKTVSSLNSPQITLAEKFSENSSFENQSDVEIWEKFKSGDESAFIYIYSKYFSELINYGVQFTSKVNLVEDCVQDLFIQLRKSRKKLGIIRKSIRLYLYISLKRRLIDKMKLMDKRELSASNFSKEFEIVLPSETHIIQNDILKEKRVMLEKAMKQLTPRQREVIYYIYYNNFSYADTREIMKIKSVKTVRNLLYRALGSLRSIVRHTSFLALTLIT